MWHSMVEEVQRPSSRLAMCCAALGDARFAGLMVRIGAPERQPRGWPSSPSLFGLMDLYVMLGHAMCVPEDGKMYENTFHYCRVGVAR